ncbi:alpha/beta fold hydrolase [Streptomyces sp. BI20]|uniref:alpha/beta fold hydrolase n=1 Tax=Streptomyces sp. BI20 TaxID=3403460 RepID=UPI003C728BFD
MTRRFEVVGAGGVRLSAWSFDAEGDGPREPVRRADGGPTADAPPADTDRVVPRPRRAAPAHGPGPDHRAPDPRPGLLFLHGLMGRAAHWAPAARLLAPTHRAVALDQRGHGPSGTPHDGPWTRDAFVADAEAAVEQLDLGPVTVVGHGMGALVGWNLAARRPDLVGALVICDMRAAALGARSQEEWAEWLGRWPLPFSGPEAARRWFAIEDPRLERPDPARGAFFTEVVRPARDGWRPTFSRRRMLAIREAWVHDAHWEDLARVTCPTLVLRGIDGELGRAEAQEMVRVLPRGRYAEVSDAGHWFHVDRPDRWLAAVEPFLRGVRTP